MKKSTIFILVLVMSFVFVFGEESGEKKLFVEVQTNLLLPSDSGYKDVYGSSVFYPGFEAGFKIINDYYIFVGYGILKTTGNTPVLEEEAKSTQQIFSLGLGYEGDFSKKFGYRVEVGGVSFSYKEEVFGEKVTGSKFGFLLKAGIVYFIGENLYISSFLSYETASDNIDGEDIKLGGFGALLGFGVKF